MLFDHVGYAGLKSCVSIYARCQPREKRPYLMVTLNWVAEVFYKAPKH